MRRHPDSSIGSFGANQHWNTNCHQQILLLLLFSFCPFWFGEPTLLVFHSNYIGNGPLFRCPSHSLTHSTAFQMVEFTKNGLKSANSRKDQPKKEAARSSVLVKLALDIDLVLNWTNWPIVTLLTLPLTLANQLLGTDYLANCPFSLTTLAYSFNSLVRAVYFYYYLPVILFFFILFETNFQGQRAWHTKTTGLVCPLRSSTCPDIISLKILHLCVRVFNLCFVASLPALVVLFFITD